MKKLQKENKIILKMNNIKNQTDTLCFFGGMLMFFFLLLTIFLMIVGGLGSLFGIETAFVHRCFFSVFSILGNLVIWELIFCSMKLADVKFSKGEWIILSSIWALIGLYYISTIVGRTFIYYWDFSNYLSMQYVLEQTFCDNLFKGIYRVITSFSGDYTMFINIFLEFPFCLTNRSGNAYVLVQLVNILFPLLVVIGMLLKKLNTCLLKQKRLWVFFIGMLVAATCPLLHSAAIKAQPDWLGLIFCGLIVILTLDYKFQKNNLLQNIIIFVLTISLILSRRWYLYFVVSWYLGYGVSVLLDIMKKRKEDSAAVKIQLKNFLIFAIVSVMIAGVLFAKMIAHILFYNYSERYAVYSRGGLLPELENQIQLLGIFMFFLIAAGIILALFKSIYREYVIRAVSGSIIAIVMFTRVQNMGKHQSLMLMPYYILMLFISLILLAKFAKYAWLQLAGYSILGCFIVANVWTNYFDTKMHMPILAQCNVVAQEREDYEQISLVARWIDENCKEEENAYVIPHCNKYNPDLFRNVLFPNMSVWNKIPYGSAVPGTHAFPTELFTAKYVITCNPFPSDLDYTALAAKYDELFHAISESKFELAETFDMENGTDIHVYKRMEKVDYNEVEAYRTAMNDENAKFPDLFDDVLDEFIRVNNLLPLPNELN